MCARILLLCLLLATVLVSRSCGQFTPFAIPIGPGYGDTRFSWTYDTRVEYSRFTLTSEIFSTIRVTDILTTTTGFNTTSVYTTTTSLTTSTVTAQSTYFIFTTGTPLSGSAPTDLDQAVPAWLIVHMFAFLWACIQ